MKVEPHLSFEGRCDEAIEFYKTAVGASVMFLVRYKDSPQPPPSGNFPADFLEKVMHATLRIGESVVRVSDGHCKGAAKFEGITLTLKVSSDAEAERCFAALSQGGVVAVPMAPTFFSSRFGMLTDRFGVAWMFLVHKE